MLERLRKSKAQIPHLVSARRKLRLPQPGSFLKARSRAISLHDMDDQRAFIDGIPHKIILSV
jgi:hypothetical protein